MKRADGCNDPACQLIVSAQGSLLADLSRLGNRVRTHGQGLRVPDAEHIWVLAILGRDWLPGLKPAAHVGANVAAKLEQFINELDGFEAPPQVEFEISVREQAKRQPSAAPVGQAAPERTTAPVTSFVRDPTVKAWVLARAKGDCECCRSPSPFVTPDGTPFLEVNHLRTLADGGSNRPSNATALCPNCHRRMHYGKDAELIRATVFKYVDELQSE